MTPYPWTDLLVIAGLILLNGLFAMSELAIVSARTAKLSVAAEGGSGAAGTAIALAADPGKFLSTVQIGITLVGIIAGAYSGASLGGPTGERLAMLGVPAEWAGQAGFALVIALTTYFNLVVGELVPKQVALRVAEPIAMLMARPMMILAKVAAPVVWLLDRSSELVLRAIGIRRSGEQRITAEELQMIFAEATRSGVIEEEERAILSGVIRLSDRPVRELMTPRNQVDWLEADGSAAQIHQAVVASPHSLLPVARGSVDEILGVVKAREVLAALMGADTIDLPALIKRAQVVPDRLDAVDGLRILQSGEAAIALVHDEYGHFEGIVTPSDLLTAIAGDFASDADLGEGPQIVEREDGSLLVSGSLQADALTGKLGIGLHDDRDYATTAGFALAVLKRLPSEGEYFDWQGWRFEIVDMDGRRIDKLLVSAVAEEDEEDQPG